MWEGGGRGSSINKRTRPPAFAQRSPRIGLSRPCSSMDAHPEPGRGRPETPLFLGLPKGGEGSIP